jgi:aryl carrier-like protein
MAEMVIKKLQNHPDIEKSKLPKNPTIKEWMREVAREKYPHATNAGPPRKK